MSDRFIGFSISSALTGVQSTDFSRAFPFAKDKSPTKVGTLNTVSSTAVGTDTESRPTRITRGVAKFFFDAQELIVFRNSI